MSDPSLETRAWSVPVESLGFVEPKLAAVALAIGRGSELIEAAVRARKRPGNILGLLVRPLTREEIAVMEDRGCRADDWTKVVVAEDFDPFRVRRTHLAGDCVLGRFRGEVEVAPGLRLPTGIYDCTLISCQVGNDCLLEGVRFAAHTVVEREAVLFDVGSITCSQAAVFGCGQDLPIACETGGRELPVWAELDVDSAAQVARFRADRAGQAEVRAAVGRYVEAVRSPVSWVRRGAVVRHTDRIRDVYLGPGAVVDHALDLTDVAVLSDLDERTVVEGGASVHGAVLQWGVRVSGNAIVRHAVLLEHSGADENGVIENSVIGPNSVIAKGEVTASLVGPFTGFHHQSLLIAAFWPEGRGNVAYGAMVGSNHTGRAPDQEIWPGEGTFFGLGCSIRFPSDFSESPYTVIAAGVATLPQKLRFPFSLIAQPAEALDDGGRIPRAYNEVLPGWGIYANAYGLERTEVKLAKRDAAKRHHFRYHVLRPEIIALVRDALSRLEAVREAKPWYLDEDIPGIGKNFLRESARQKAIEAYRRALLRYGLRILLGEAEGKITIPGSTEIAHSIVDELLPGTDRAARLRRLIAIEEENARIVQASREADDARGARIIEGYADVHGAAGDDPVVQRAGERVRTTRERVEVVLAK